MSWTPEQTPATAETEDHIEYAVSVDGVGYLQTASAIPSLRVGDGDPSLFLDEVSARETAHRLQQEYIRLGLTATARSVRVIQRTVTVTTNRGEWA